MTMTMAAQNNMYDVLPELMGGNMFKTLSMKICATPEGGMALLCFVFILELWQSEKNSTPLALHWE